MPAPAPNHAPAFPQFPFTQHPTEGLPSDPEFWIHLQQLLATNVRSLNIEDYLNLPPATIDPFGLVDGAHPPAPTAAPFQPNTQDVVSAWHGSTQVSFEENVLSERADAQEHFMNNFTTQQFSNSGGGQAFQFGGANPSTLTAWGFVLDPPFAAVDPRELSGPMEVESIVEDDTAEIMDQDSEQIETDYKRPAYIKTTPSTPRRSRSTPAGEYEDVYAHTARVALPSPSPSPTASSPGSARHFASAFSPASSRSLRNVSTDSSAEDEEDGMSEDGDNSSDDESEYAEGPRRRTIARQTRKRKAVDVDSSDEYEMSDVDGDEDAAAYGRKAKRAVVSTPLKRARVSASTSTSAAAARRPRAGASRSNNRAHDPPASAEPYVLTPETIEGKEGRNNALLAASDAPAAAAGPRTIWHCGVDGCAYVQENKRHPELKRHRNTHDTLASAAHGSVVVVCCGVPLDGEDAFDAEGRQRWVGGCKQTFSRWDAAARHWNTARSRCCEPPRWNPPQRDNLEGARPIWDATTGSVAFRPAMRKNSAPSQSTAAKGKARARR